MILILGGTGDAHRIALELQSAGIDFTVSLAGATKRPTRRSYPVRTGGFGGVEGLAKYLEDYKVTGMVDATHPFAQNISESAVEAARKTGVPMVRYLRVDWDVSDVSACQFVQDLDEAARILPSGARAFLTVGGNSLKPFVSRPDVWFLFRGVEPMENPFSQGEALVQRPPFTLQSEIALMKEHAITHLVTKNAGGEQTRAKIDAAKELGIPVIMVERPVLPVVEDSSTVLGILRWIEQL